MRILMLLLSLGSAYVYGDDADGQENAVDEYSIYKDAFEFVQGCGKMELSSCLKERFLRYIDCLPHNLDLGGGLAIKANDDQENDRTSRQHAEIVLPDDPKAREEALDKALLETLSEYAKSHTLEFRFLKGGEREFNESVVEGRKKKGGGGGGGIRLRPMMMLLQLKAAAIGAIALKFIALVAFKALLVAKVALVIAGIVALKKLVEQKHSSTYEVVAHPHFDDRSHFDRSFNQDLAYRGYDGARQTN